MPPKPGPKPSLPRSLRPESPTTARKGTKCPDLFEESLAPRDCRHGNRGVQPCFAVQAGRWADQEQAQAYDQQQADQQQQPVYAAPAPAAPTADMDSKLAQLKELANSENRAC